MNRQSFIQKYPLFSYFALAFGITWAGVMLVLATVDFQVAAVGLPQFGLIFLAMASGPSLSSVLLTSLTGGRAGWQDLWARLGRWRLGWRWVAAALLTAPAIAVGVLAALAALLGPEFGPGFAPAGLVIGLAAGFFEEIGWTGFALPRLYARLGIWPAGILPRKWTVGALACHGRNLLFNWLWKGPCARPGSLTNNGVHAGSRSCWLSPAHRLFGNGNLVAAISCSHQQRGLLRPSGIA